MHSDLYLKLGIAILMASLELLRWGIAHWDQLGRR